jgi:hypothetical protein
VGTFRVRKSINVIPGILRLNASGAASRAKGAGGSTSWTIHLGKLISYNTRDGRWSINPPGPGSWQSGTRKQRKAAKARKKAERNTRRQAEQERWTRHFEERNAGGAVPVMGIRRAEHVPAGAPGGTRTAGGPEQPGAPEQITAEQYGMLNREERADLVRRAGLCGAPTKDRSPCMNYAGTCPHH